jgi:Holliday junction resolvase-like predicted endonuclease
MKEQQIQSKVIKLMESKGYYVLKLSKTNKHGIPDLLCLKKDEPPFFIEVKTDKGVVSALQLFRQKELKELGFKSIIINNTNSI